jgi:hypothetical protein
MVSSKIKYPLDTGGNNKRVFMQLVNCSKNIKQWLPMLPWIFYQFFHENRSSRFLKINKIENSFALGRVKIGNSSIMKVFLN